MPPEFMPPSRRGYFITIIDAGITPGSAWRPVSAQGVVSALVNILKGTSSRMLRQARPDIARRSYKGILWSPSYFAASTGGATLETIKRYVEAQRSAPPPRPKGRGFRRGKSR